MFDWEQLHKERDEKRSAAVNADHKATSAGWARDNAKAEADRAQDNLDFARWAEKYLRGLYEASKAEAKPGEGAK